jgi:hypothetical protein
MGDATNWLKGQKILWKVHSKTELLTVPRMSKRFQILMKLIDYNENVLVTQVQNWNSSLGISGILDFVRRQIF